MWFQVLAKDAPPAACQLALSRTAAGRRMAARRRGSAQYSVPEIPPFRSRAHSTPSFVSLSKHSKPFSTPLLSSLFSAVLDKKGAADSDRTFSDGLLSEQSTDRAPTGADDNSYLMPEASHHATASKGGITSRGNNTQLLEITVKNHPTLPGVIVSELGASGAAAAAGLHVGDHIVSVNGHAARNHRRAIEVADSAEGSVTFSLADKTRRVLIDRHGGFREGNVGITCVNNTVAGLGVVVVGLKGGDTAIKAGIEVGDVINSINGELALEHSRVIEIMDAEMGTLELCLASKKLTETSVLNQWADHVPCSIVVES